MSPSVRETIAWDAATNRLRIPRMQTLVRLGRLNRRDTIRDRGDLGADAASSTRGSRPTPSTSESHRVAPAAGAARGTPAGSTGERLALRKGDDAAIAILILDGFTFNRIHTATRRTATSLRLVANVPHWTGDVAVRHAPEGRRLRGGGDAGERADNASPRRPRRRRSPAASPPPPLEPEPGRWRQAERTSSIRSF